jgi:hypothetical protein
MMIELFMKTNGSYEDSKQDYIDIEPDNSSDGSPQKLVYNN